LPRRYLVKYKRFDQEANERAVEKPRRLFLFLRCTASILAQQLWQLGDIRRNPPRLVACQKLGRRIAGRALLRKTVSPLSKPVRGVKVWARVNQLEEERINTMSELATALYEEEVLHSDEVPDAALELAGSKLWEGPAASFTVSFCSGIDTCPSSPTK